MPTKLQARKPRRFFTEQLLKENGQELWLQPSETHHLRDIIRLKPGNSCLVTDGQGREGEAVIREFLADGRTCLRITRIKSNQSLVSDHFIIRVMPVLLQKGKTDFLIEKAQELGVDEIQPLFSDRCAVKVTKEKKNKMLDRWMRIAREASKQSGSLQILRIKEPVDFKTAVVNTPLAEPLIVFHPGPESISFSVWCHELRDSKETIQTFHLFIGPEGGFSEEEIAWVRWKRHENQYRLVNLGENLLKADTAFVGIIAALRFSGILSQ